MPPPAPPPPQLRSPGDGDLAWMLDLNNAHARELSWLTADELKNLVGTASYVAVQAPVAFVLCFGRDADHDSPNHAWFRDAYDRFLYVDRVVVSPSARGTGIARRLYAGVFQAAADAGAERVVAEINVKPPNPGSDRFHERLGFVEVGRARLADRDKAVRYVAAPVGH